MLGELSVGRLAKGKSAQVVGDPDQPHSFTYVPDIARALMTVADADDAMGAASNVPNAPDKTLREMKEMLYQWQRPFLVDSSRFGERFWADATSFEVGVATTAPSYPTS